MAARKQPPSRRQHVELGARLQEAGRDPGPGGPSSCCPTCGDPYLGGPGCYWNRCANDDAGQAGIEVRGHG